MTTGYLNWDSNNTPEEAGTDDDGLVTMYPTFSGTPPAEFREYLDGLTYMPTATEYPTFSGTPPAEFREYLDGLTYMPTATAWPGSTPWPTYIIEWEPTATPRPTFMIDDDVLLQQIDEYGPEFLQSFLQQVEQYGPPPPGWDPNDAPFP